MRLVEQNEIKNYEPNCVGLKAIWSPHTGIVDWAQVNESFGEDFKSLGGHIHTNFEAKNFQYDQDSNDYPVKLTDSTGNKIVKARYVVTAAGLHADRIAKLTAGHQNPRIGNKIAFLKPNQSIVLQFRSEESISFSKKKKAI